VVIQNSYSGFGYDNFKVALWLQLLEDVPFDLAQRNLRAFILNPGNRFPPHPGELTQLPAEVARGADVPNAEETRAMLAAYDRDPRQHVPALPPCVSELKARLLADGQN
jgi:hypothetical protein